MGANLRRLLQEEYEALPVPTGPEDGSRYAAMARILEAIQSDLRRLEAGRIDPPWSELIGLVLLLGASARLAGIAIDRGDLRNTRQALLAGIAGAAHPNHTDVHLGRVLILADPDQPLPDAVVSEPVVRWSELLFVYDRFRGGFDSLTRPLFASLEPWVVERLGTDDEYAFLALAMAQWSIRRDVDDHRLLQAIDLLVASGGVPLEGEAGFLILDLQRRARRDYPGVPRLAYELLESRRGRLTGTEMFQLVGLLAHDTASAVENADAIVRAIEALMRDWRTTTPGALFMADRRGAHFPLLGNVISAFIEEGRADLLGPILGAWIEVPAEERRTDLLYWVVSGRPGVGWAFDRAVSLRQDRGSDTVHYVRALSAFLNLGITIRGEDTDPGGRLADGEPGVPSEAAAAEFHDTAQAVLDLEPLRHVLDSAAPNAPGALVLLQDIGSPAQPLLLREFGRTFPWSVSLRQPLPDRTVRRAAVLLTGTDLGRLEVEAVAAVLRCATVDVEVASDGSLSAGEFLSRYTDPSYDLLWVVGHGIYDHDDPDKSHLPMPDGSQVTVADLERDVPNSSRRRLLVLNLCDAAAALVAGGLPEFGLAVRAAGPRQACIGHRWPVVGWPDAILTGRLLAGSIPSTRSFFEAYERTVGLLAGSVTEIQAELTGPGGPVDVDLREGLDRNLQERVERLSCWASLAFLE
jgi:hypothetical protein